MIGLVSQHGCAARGLELTRQSPGHVVDRDALVQRDDRHHSDRIGQPGRPCAGGKTSGERAAESDRELVVLGDRPLERPAIDSQERRVAHGPYRGRPGLSREQRELADHSAALHGADHLVFDDHLQPTGLDHERAVGGLARAEQPSVRLERDAVGARHQALDEHPLEAAARRMLGELSLPHAARLLPAGERRAGQHVQSAEIARTGR